jgi:hypothetical protein
VIAIVQFCNNFTLYQIIFEEKTAVLKITIDIATFNNWSKGTIPSPDYINADCSLFTEIS